MPTNAGQTDAATDGSQTAPAARDYFRTSLEVIRRSPVLAAWKVLGDLLGGFLRPLAFLWCLALLLVALRAGGLESFTLAGLAAVADGVDPGLLTAGAGGLAVTLWLVGTTLEALVSGGLYASIARGLQDRTVDGFGELLECVGEGFPRVFLLRVAGGAAELTLALLGLTVVIAIGVPFTSYGELATWSNASKAALIAFPAFAFLSLGLIVRLTFQVAAAPLFLDDSDDGPRVGEAIADGARFLIVRLAGVYRLLVFAASLLLIPLLAYWGWTVIGSLVGLESPIAPLFSAGRLVGQVLLYTAASLIAVLFYGAIFAYYGARTGGLEVEARESTAPQSPDQPITYDETTRLAELLPEQNDRVVDFSQIPGLEEEVREDEDEG